MLLKKLIELDESIEVKKIALQELGKAWKDDPEILYWIKETAKFNSIVEIRSLAVQVLGQTGKDNPEIQEFLKTCAESDATSYVRSIALEQLSLACKNQPDYLVFFSERAMSDPFERKYSLENNPRQIALQTVVKQYPGHPQTLALLNNRAKYDADEEVKNLAISYLKAFYVNSNTISQNT